MNNFGVIVNGLKCPIIKNGDSIPSIALSVLDGYIQNAALSVDDKDVLCITESIVARAQGNYVTVNDICQFLGENSVKKSLILYSPIMSRNRFSVILRGLTRFADSIEVILHGACDEQGNPNYGINPFSGVDIQQYYQEIAQEEQCNLHFTAVENTTVEEVAQRYDSNACTFIDARCHPTTDKTIHTLAWVLSTPVQRADESWSGNNEEYGVLGSNKSDDETLKLFPKDCFALCQSIQALIEEKYGKKIEVLVYGDGCFKDPVGGIWEFADPITCPGYTEGLVGTPNELKLKALVDTKYNELSGDALKEAISNEIKNKKANLVGSMESQGTTPRRYIDLLASLADLTSGSGDKGTPMVYIKNYFNNYSN